MKVKTGIYNRKKRNGNMMNETHRKLKIGIVGGAGYTAGELLRIVLRHPNVKVDFVYSTSSAGQALHTIHYDLLGVTDLCFTDQVNPTVDVVFLCTAHGGFGQFPAGEPLLRTHAHHRLVERISPESGLQVRRAQICVRPARSEPGQDRPGARHRQPRLFRHGHPTGAGSLGCRGSVAERRAHQRRDRVYGRGRQTLGHDAFFVAGRQPVVLQTLFAPAFGGDRRNPGQAQRRLGPRIVLPAGAWHAYARHFRHGLHGF